MREKQWEGDKENQLVVFLLIDGRMN